jgi:ACS family glucarate transporter-like MFS transporter
VSSDTAALAMIRRRVPVRFRILGLLLVISFINYVLRNNISIALPSIRDEFDFTSTELGWILASFNVAYTLFQMPGGVFGQALGPRRALTIIIVTWGVLTLFTGFVPHLLAASAVASMVGLMVVRFLTGASHAPVFPVTTGAIANWFPVGRWALPNALSTTAISLGQAANGPMVTALIVTVGWRGSFYALAPLAFLVAALWWWYARDTPADHPAVDRDERTLIERNRVTDAQAARVSAGLREFLRDRNVVLIAASYFCMNCVFYMFADWLFTYLIEERGFSLLAGGAMYALPFIVGAIFAALGGLVCDALCQRIGPRWGCRVPPIVGLLMAAALLLAGARVTDPYLAVGVFALCFGFIQFTDSAFWVGTAFAAGSRVSVGCGVMNTGGNLPGFLAPLIGWMIDHAGWLPTFAVGSLMAVIGAGLWLLIDVSRTPARS